MDENPKQVVEQGYDKVAEAYAHLEDNTEWPRMRWLAKMLTMLDAGASVLDLGCGSGDPADIEIAKKHHVTGVDISRTQIELAREKVPDGIFLQGDAGSVAFSDASFDAVISFYTLEHIPRAEHDAILRRIHRWLRVDGLFLFTIEAGDYDDVMGEWLGVPMFISCFPPQTMKKMVARAGFEMLDMAVETQLEGGEPIEYLWVLARKKSA